MQEGETEDERVRQEPGGGGARWSRSCGNQRAPGGKEAIGGQEFG